MFLNLKTHKVNVTINIIFRESIFPYHIDFNNDPNANIPLPIYDNTGNVDDYLCKPLI